MSNKFWNKFLNHSCLTLNTFSSLPNYTQPTQNSPLITAQTLRYLIVLRAFEIKSEESELNRKKSTKPQDWKLRCLTAPTSGKFPVSWSYNTNCQINYQISTNFHFRGKSMSVKSIFIFFYCQRCLERVPYRAARAEVTKKSPWQFNLKTHKKCYQNSICSNQNQLSSRILFRFLWAKLLIIPATRKRGKRSFAERVAIK